MKRSIKTPMADDEWRANLRAYSMRVGFNVHLTKTMLEFLCAVADDVCWDRALYWKDGAIPENWFASSGALVKRGMIRRKSPEYFESKKSKPLTGNWKDWCEVSNWELTPAGVCIVELIKLSGMFIEADAAINKKSRRA